MTLRVIENQHKGGVLQDGYHLLGMRAIFSEGRS
jgi:hypothetical protein